MPCAEAAACLAASLAFCAIVAALSPAADACAAALAAACVNDHLAQQREPGRPLLHMFHFGTNPWSVGV